MSRLNERFALVERTALITEASSGIGSKTAEVFANASAAIVAHGRNVERSGKLRQRLAIPTYRFTAISVDLVLPSGVEELTQQTLKTHPKINILVKSAGIALTRPVINYDFDQWQRTLDINLTAPFLLSQALLARKFDRKWAKLFRYRRKLL